MPLDKVLGALGKTFIGAGILVFLFVAYQLWGTNITEARNQNRLKSQAAQLFEQPTVTTPAGSAEPVPNTTPAPPPAPAGAAVAVIRIPKIEVEKAVVAGTAVTDLKKGPGHYSSTPLPGQPGNAAIAGHRTTYGAPFSRIGELEPGDEILTTTRQGSFTYRVKEKKVVSPFEVGVLSPTADNRLTLTTCHPKYSAAQRLIVIAELTAEQAPALAAPPTTAPPAPDGSATTVPLADESLAEADLSGSAVPKTPVAIWAFITFLVGLGVALAARFWRKWTSYLVGAPVFLLVLFIFFENFARLLPANA